MTAILDSFIDDVRQRLASVKQGLESADAGWVEAEAFNLKGSSANIGAKDLARTASAVEEACSEGDLDKARQLVDSFIDEFRMFQWATNNLVASFPEHDRLKDENEDTHRRG